MIAPELQDILNDMADVLNRSAEVFRSGAMNMEILEMMIQNMERATTQLYRVRNVMILDSL